MVTADYPTLTNPASRWQMLPQAGQEDEVPLDAGKASFIMLLRDIAADPSGWDDFVKGVKSLPAASDGKSLISAIARDLDTSGVIGHDYLPDESSRGPKRRKLNMVGNATAAPHLKEQDELIALGRTVYKVPTDLDEPFEAVFKTNIRNIDMTPEQIMGFARAWAEIRYRYLNHALRDDPYEWINFQSGPAHVKGNAANALVHESNILEDAKVVEFLRIGSMGYNDSDRGLFERLYLISPEEAQKLGGYCGQSTGLRVGLPETFRYCAGVIDAYLNWRIRVLTSARQQILSDRSVRGAFGQQAKERAMGNLHSANQGHIRAADDAYSNHFLHSLRLLLDEASTQNAFNRSSWDALQQGVTVLITNVQACPLNQLPSLAHNPNFVREVNVFPNLNRALIMPTGTSMITMRRPLNRN